MAKPKLPEAQLILKSIESKYVLALYELNKNTKLVEPILELLDSIKQMDLKKILDSAGGVYSMDKMIDNAVEQSYRRGRISTSVLFRALLINAEKEMERREHQK
jgi:2-hydroxy-3-keto-5-methylthiopentenyl-1-phosphate phosphatase